MRRRLNLSRGFFAAYLRINVRTLENWEQGRARPNAQAAVQVWAHVVSLGLASIGAWEETEGLENGG